MSESEQRPEPSLLLEDFLSSGRSEASFSILVRSLGGLVYSSALRRTRNSELSEEIAQNVFAILARKADSLRRHPSLMAWIFETTRLEAASAMRSEKRHQRKLAALAEESGVSSGGIRDAAHADPAWKDAVPVLDEVLDRLSMSERKVIFQRFYQGRKFGEIATSTGQSEGACKMRLKRALQKMSALLSRRGVTLTATAVAAGLGTELARSAPASVLTAVAPKALTASASLSTTSMIFNAVQTMSTIKTTTATAAIVIAIAAIPFSLQMAEGSRIQSELQALQEFEPSPASARSSSGLEERDEISGSQTAPPRSASSLLASYSQPVGNRALLRSLMESQFGSDPVERAGVWSRVARMSRDEHNQLLADLQTFPCDRVTKDLMAAIITNYAPDISPREHLSRLLERGRESSSQSVMRDWARSEPDAALAWYQKKKASGELLPGLNDELHQSVVTDLLVGLASSRPDRALEFYRDTPRAEFGNQALEWLAGAYGQRMIESGDERHVMELLDTHSGNYRQEIIGAVFGQYGNSGRFDDGLAFVDAHNPDPDARFRFIEEMVPWASDIAGALEWAVSITPEAEAPAAARRLVRTANRRRHTAGEAAREWIERQPAGPVRDQGIAGVVDFHSGSARFGQALSAADNIGDAALRNSTRESVARTWLRRNEPEATEGLPADLLQQLLNQ